MISTNTETSVDLDKFRAGRVLCVLVVKIDETKLIT